MNPTANPDASSDANALANAEDEEARAVQAMLLAFGPRFAEIAREYQASLPQRLAAMQDAASMGAYDVLAHAAHRLAGGSASLGATRVSQLCRLLEDECAAGRIPSDCKERLAAIDRACQAFCLHLQALEQS